MPKIHRLCTVLMWGASLYVSVGMAEDKLSKQHIDEIQHDIQHLKNHLGKQEKKHLSLSKKLHHVESKISRVIRKLRQNKEKIIEEKTRLKQLEINKKVLDKTLAVLKDTVETYIVAAYMSQNNALKQLLGGKKLADVERYTVYRNYLYDDQLKQMDQLLMSMQQADVLSKEIQQRIGMIVTAKKHFDRENQQLKKDHEKRQALLAIVNDDIRRTQGELKRLKKQEARLKGIIDKLAISSSRAPRDKNNKGLAKLRKGRLHWPISGKVVKRYGHNRIGGMRWNGMVIKAPLGSMVKAAFSGKIVFSDWLRGYGLLIIIDHGQSVMSLYGYNEAIDRFVGESVEKGESIARSGADDQNYPSSYFELRVKGKPVNPMHWLRHLN